MSGQGQDAGLEMILVVNGNIQKVKVQVRNKEIINIKKMLNNFVIKQKSMYFIQ